MKTRWIISVFAGIIVLDPALNANKKTPGRSKGVFAPPLGLEPRTYWLTASRSNQLSYGGIDAQNRTAILAYAI